LKARHCLSPKSRLRPDSPASDGSIRPFRSNCDERRSRSDRYDARAKQDIGDVIPMLELMLRQARQISRMMGDAGKKGFGSQIAILESQLEFARNETRKL
jgi:hypothetical protein